MCGVEAGWAIDFSLIIQEVDIRGSFCYTTELVGPGATSTGAPHDDQQSCFRSSVGVAHVGRRRSAWQDDGTCEQFGRAAPRADERSTSNAPAGEWRILSRDDRRRIFVERRRQLRCHDWKNCLCEEPKGLSDHEMQGEECWWGGCCPPRGWWRGCGGCWDERHFFDEKDVSSRRIVPLDDRLATGGMVGHSSTAEQRGFLFLESAERRNGGPASRARGTRKSRAMPVLRGAVRCIRGTS